MKTKIITMLLILLSCSLCYAEEKGKLVAAVVMIQGDTFPSDWEVNQIISYFYPNEAGFDGFILKAKYAFPIDNKEIAKEKMLALSKALLAKEDKDRKYFNDKHDIYENKGAIYTDTPDEKLISLLAVILN